MLDWLIPYTFEYFAHDEESGRSGLFRFKVVKKLGRGYFAYILDRPPLDGRDGSMHKVHVLTDDNEKPYVCVVQTIETKKKMIAVAKFWARRYLRYVATGKLYEEK